MIAPPAIEETFSRHRPMLFGLAYRMLGSGADAEDVVQDAFVRWLQGGERDVQSPKSYLAAIVVRLCIDRQRSARARRETYSGPWLPEPLPGDQDEGPAQTALLRESLSYAFLVMLERLAPLERAVFVLREAFEYDYPEIGAIVGKSEANCRQILHRARERVADCRPRFDVPEEQQQRVTEQFLRASLGGGLDALLRLLTDDAVLTVDGGGKVAAAGTRPVHGARNVARGMLGGLSKLPAGVMARIERINGQPAIVGYVDGRPIGVVLLEIAGERIRSFFLVLNPDKLGRLRQLSQPA